MLGNDLIDLSTTAQHTPKRFSRYLEKVFTVIEREAITASRFSFLPHLFWAAKEAAFKAYMQVYPEKEKFYAPKKFEVKLNNVQTGEAAGTVSFEEHTWFFTAQITTTCIHCIACINETQLTKVLWKIEAIRSNDGRYLEHKTLGKIQLLNNARGIPEPYVNKQKLEGYASVSHDGERIAYALLIQENNAG